MTTDRALDELRGWQAARAGVRFSPYETEAWRTGWKIYHGMTHEPVDISKTKH